MFGVNDGKNCLVNNTTHLLRKGDQTFLDNYRPIMLWTMFLNVSVKHVVAKKFEGLEIRLQPNLK